MAFSAMEEERYEAADRFARLSMVMDRAKIAAICREVDQEFLTLFGEDRLPRLWADSDAIEEDVEEVDD
jgi:hypothetical protein